MGHVITSEGIKKSPEKVEAIQQAKRPKNIVELRQFLGLINHYHRFIPDASTILKPLNELKEHSYKWNKKCEEAFIKIKEILASEKVLVTYDPKLPLILETDASPVGISAILSHSFPDGDRPIAYASRTLTKTEQNYSQLDREALGIFWGAKKFYQYLYGREFTFVTDNKPLQQILFPDKELPAYTATRMLRYALFLSQFNYKIIHRRAKQHEHVDYFSRAPVDIYPLNFIDESTYLQNQKIEVLNFVKSTEDQISREDLQNETKNDPELTKLRKDLENGTNQDTKYSLNQGIIFYQDRIVIPEKLKLKILAELHSTHSGIVKMKQIARNYVYWKNINSDIEKVVNECKECADVKKNPPKVQLHHWEDTSRPFQRIHIDYAEYQKENFLVIVDSYTKWIEAYHTKAPPNSTKTIKFLEEFFSRFGLCDELVSDNATIFKSEEFLKFTKKNGINKTYSAPNHPASNGLAERGVQTIKSKLKKIKNSKSVKQNLVSILAAYRNTPVVDSKTPAEMVFGYQPKSWIESLKPTKQEKITSNESSILKSRELKIGDRIQSRNYRPNEAKWKYGTVLKKFGKLHYEVKLDSGFIVKRHINQLRKTEVKKVTFEIQDEILKSRPKINGEENRERGNPEIQGENPEPILRRSGREKKPINRLNL